MISKHKFSTVGSVSSNAPSNSIISLQQSKKGLQAMLNLTLPKPTHLFVLSFVITKNTFLFMSKKENMIGQARLAAYFQYPEHTVKRHGTGFK